MHCPIRCLLALALLGCGANTADTRGDAPGDTSPEPTGTTPTTPTLPTTPTTPTSPVDERAALEEAGFVVQDGAFLFSTMEGCCAEDAYCWGNNPSTPYGTPALPSAPGEAIEAIDILEDFGPLVDPAMSRTFHLRGDEGMVLLGAMPPAAKYFSYRSYLGLRPGDIVIGSLGASLNHAVVAEARGVAEDDVWGTPVAIVTSSDADVEDRIVASLVAAGWDPAHIHPDRIPPEVVNLGYDAADDTFFALMRVAVYDDPAVGEAWQAHPGFTVYRVSGDPDAPLTRPHPIDDLPSRGTGTDEEAWREALDALEAAALEAYPVHTVAEVPVLPYWNETIACILDDGTCDGEIRDRLAAITPTFYLGADDFLVVIGVNHERTGKAAYSSFALQTVEEQRGIDAGESDEMPGSAAGLLPGHPQVDDLYAWIVARDCAPHTALPCMVVPHECPGGAEDLSLKITVRAYLEPATGAAPLATELVGDRVFKLTPAAAPTP